MDIELVFGRIVQVESPQDDDNDHFAFCMRRHGTTKVIALAIDEDDIEPILQAARGRTTTPPSPQQLMVSVLHKLEIEIVCARFEGRDDDSILLASLHLRSGERLWRIRCRASDAFSITRLAKAPLYIDEEFFQSLSPFDLPPSEQKPLTGDLDNISWDDYFHTHKPPEA
ncbi:MAG: bifunctional nuclease family protein [Candidatus Yanofskybacteria bacterium]|nr:bifunctional nuclease family protein [Candidatus Yanofskybacteria bacterium]